MTGPLAGLCVLVVEDEHLVAMALVDDLEEAGATVIGPASSIAGAFALLDGPAIDAAVLDVNLQGEVIFPLADALAARAVPFLFTTGYDSAGLPDEYADAPKCEKPADPQAIIKLIAGLASR